MDEYQHQSETPPEQPPIGCAACRTALTGDGRDGLSFLLVDHLTVPLVGCDEHLERFVAACDLTTQDSADLLNHRPAGGIQCPSCRLAVHEASQPMVPVDDGVVVVPACPNHRTDTIDRFHTGLQTRKQLTTSLEASWSV